MFVISVCAAVPVKGSAPFNLRRIHDNTPLSDAGVLYSNFLSQPLQAEYSPTLGYYLIQYLGHTPIFRGEKHSGVFGNLLNKLYFQRKQRR